MNEIVKPESTVNLARILTEIRRPADKDSVHYQDKINRIKKSKRKRRGKRQ